MNRMEALIVIMLRCFIVSIAVIGTDLQSTLLAKLEQHLCRINISVETFIFVREMGVDGKRGNSIYVGYITNTTKKAFLEIKLT